MDAVKSPYDPKEDLQEISAKAPPAAVDELQIANDSRILLAQLKRDIDKFQQDLGRAATTLRNLDFQEKTKYKRDAIAMIGPCRS